MTTVRRIPVICLLLLGLLALAGTSWAQTRPPIAEQIAKTYGLDAFGQIAQIRYTFHIAELNLSRTWIWEPKTDQVSYEGKDKAGQDQYWLVFPFHLVWDSSATVEDTGMHPLSLGKGSARRIVVTYPPSGYSPGDTGELFVGTDNRIREWVYHHGGSPPWTGVWPWEDYKKAGPLLASLNHPGKRDGKPVRVFFTDVAVTLVGGATTWVKAH